MRFVASLLNPKMLIQQNLNKIANLKPFSVNVIKMNAVICVWQLAAGTVAATKRVLAVKSNLAIYHLVNFVVGMWLWLALPLLVSSRPVAPTPTPHPPLTVPAGNLIFNESI